MWICFFFTTICGFGWFMTYVVTLAMLYYMKERGYTTPSEADMRKYITYILDKYLKKDKG